MKKRLLLTISALLCIIVGYAGNIIANDITMKPGETKTLNVSLSSSISDKYGIQFDVTLPKGFLLVKGSNGKIYEMSGSQASDLTCSDLDLGDGAYRFVIYSSTLQKLKGGSLMSLNLKVNGTQTLGNYTVAIDNVAFSDYEGNVTNESGISVGVKVTDFFTLLYKIDGKVYKSYELEYGTSITPEAEPTKEGYTFSGWSDIPKTMPAKDVTVTGTFTINKYKLTYMVDGNTYKTVTYDYGATITPEAAPTKEGYTFSGWSGVPTTMPAKDVTVTGTFTINKYKLTYMVDGTVYKSYELEYGSAITPEAEPTKEGYTFSGWSDIPATMPAKDVTVNGTFSKGSYKLIYMVDGNVYKTVTYNYGATVTPEAAPTKEGYTFSGWSGVPATMPAKDVTVTGTFTINKYELTYMVDGAVYKSYELEYGSLITPEAEPTKEGYTFSGWSDIPTTMPAKDVTVNGTFSKGSYKLTYMVDGNVYKTVTYDYGTSITPEAEPTKEGYTFSGWSELPKTMPAKDVTVTGMFTINKYKLTYMVDGVVYKSYEIEYGSVITPEAEPTKEGYTFSGWSEIPTTMPAKDVTVNGTFSKGSYKLTYMVDGNVYKTVTYDYGASITPEAEPTKEGYTFSGWSGVPATMPAKDVTVTGTFTINKYKLTYMVDGAVYKSYELEYGSAITPEAEPTKEGYTFSGWSDIPTTMPAKDVTVNGTFSKGSYKLTYMVDGTVYKIITYDYSTSITPEAAPTKEGYTFSGWSELPKTMPAKDVTVTGTFTINKYKLIYMVDGAVYKSYEIEYGSAITPEAEPTKEGYTFSGWGDIPATMPAKDVTVNGTFSKGSYKLTYMIDGNVYKTVTYDYGATITPEAEPTKEGYTFSGWSGLPKTMPAKDVTVTGTFTINKYKLTYMVDGTVYKSYEIEYGLSITPEAEPTKEGYTFSGWSDIPATMPAKDVIVNGSFSKGSYKLTYMIDGEVYKTISYDYGTTITPEAEPTKEGYTFSGWSGLPKTMPAKDVTVTGTFTINKYKLTYMVDGAVYKSYEVEYGSAITPEAEPTKEGYTFSGWGDIPATMPAKDVTVNGTFSKGSYKLTYMIDGNVYKTVTYDYGASITPEAEPTKEGYSFSGWSELPKSMPAKDITVTGTFTINKYKLTYMVDGTVYKSYELEYGSSITPEAEPTKEGYTFSGWSWTPKTMPAEDVTVTGRFSINKYKLTYMVDGEVYKSYEIEYDSKITPEPAPTKDGYSFSGWSSIPTTMPAKDVTVTGTFSKGTYKLTYMVDGEVYKTVNYDYGSVITPEPDPSKDGYTFSGWSEVPETMPAKDVTVTGTFSVNKYKLIYIVDSEEYKTYEVEYGTPITPEADPVKEGYTFSGWSWIPKKMPNEDVTVSGYFTVNKYKLTYMIGDETYKEVEIEYGSTIPTEPQPDGDYVRFEWVGVPETMPAHDVIVYADFETGIMDVMALHGVRCIYSPNGKRISKLQKGVNIVVMNDGSVKKVYVK